MMRTLVLFQRSCTVTCGLLICLGARVAAQGTNTPVVQAATRAAPLRAAVLERVVAVHLERATLRHALTVIAQMGGVKLTFAANEIPDRVVSLVTDRIKVGDALKVVLEDTGLGVLVLPSGRIVLRPGSVATEVARQNAGTIAGRVVDGATKAPLDQVAVRVDGTGLGTVSSADGRYTIHGVSSGTYHVTARRVGYTPLTKVVTIATDTTAADFVLAAVATKLNEVVTTAVGDQRRYEVGNTISTINADSIAPTAPITSLTDLISARAPGVTVEETGGLAGSGQAIRIRGLSTLVLQGDPIVIVDGVRQDNAAGGRSTLINGPGGGQVLLAPSRLNDLDFSDIQSIDVLKGPSASTEYGTDAANGVIVITTKHGTVGRPHWQASAEETRSAIPKSFPTNYYRWGHTTDPSHTVVQCPLVPFFLTGGVGSAAGTCVADSITAWNSLNQPSYSVFGPGNRQKYDVSVSGGTEAVRYYVAGSVANELGTLRMPSVFLGQARALGLPNSLFNPNSLNQRSARGNTAVRLGPMADLSVSAAYLSTNQATVNEGLLTNGPLGTALHDSAHVFGYASAYASPVANFGQPTTQGTNRVTGGMTANWHPALWFVGHATVGIDHGSQETAASMLPQVTPSLIYFRLPQLEVGNATTDIYTVDLRGSATAALTPGLRAVTSVGLQLADTRTQGVSVIATGVTATNLTLNGAVNVAPTQTADRQATLGGYAEEQIGVADRLFLTGALRVDAGSGFGRSYSSAVYPKASVSWLAANTGLSSLRLRAAFGESGIQPPNGAALQLYAPTTDWSGGGLASSVQIANVQNQTLRPERSVEFEGGADLGLWGSRLSMEVTGYSKTTRDALVSVGAGWDLGGYPYEENVGKVRNTGAEATITATVLQARPLTWNLTLNASVNHNTLLALAPGVPAQEFIAWYAEYRFVRDYPLYGYWARGAQYADLNHDGIIEPNEVILGGSGNAERYAGSALPTREASVGNRVALWGGAVSVNALVDYRGGFRLMNTSAALAAGFSQGDRASNYASAPLWQQARDVAIETSFASGFYASPAGFAEDATFLRFRELSLTYAVPRRIVRVLRVGDLSVTGAVRNLALWTRYTGADPEAANSGGANVQFNPTSNTFTANNNMREDYGTVPLARYWVVRLNVGL